MTTPFAAASLPPNTSFFPPPASFMSSIPPYSPSVATSASQNLNCTSDTSLRSPSAVFYSSFCISGLVGNSFASWVFVFVHSSHNSVRVFLINCAVADSVLSACSPFRVFYHLNGNRWMSGSVACKMVGNGFYMNMYISITSSGLISSDRYVRSRGKGKARRSVWGKSRGHRQSWSWLVCGAVWSSFSVGTAVMVTTKEDKDDKEQCFQYKQRLTVSWKAYINAASVSSFWSVFVMLVASYAKIASQLLQLSQKKPDLPNAQKYKKTARKSFFVLFSFTICFAPYHAFRPVYILSQIRSPDCSYIQMVDRTNEIMLLSSTFNSCSDPVMYFSSSGSVRRTASQILGHRLGARFHFLQNVTLNSSTMDYRRGSAPSALPDQVLNNPSLTPRTSFCVINSTLRRTGPTTLSPPGHQ